MLSIIPIAYTSTSQTPLFPHPRTTNACLNSSNHNSNPNHPAYIKMAAVLQDQKTALITGAASGIGFAVAKLCRNRGMHLALLDVDAVNLPKARDVLASADASLKTESYTIDVGDKSQWDIVAAKIQSTFPTIDLVLLNAARGTKPKDSSPWINNTGYWRQVRQNPHNISE